MGWPGGAGYGRAVALSLSFSFTNPFHIGAVVPDLETAMEEVASGHGVTWAKVQERQQSLWTPTLGAVVTPLRFSYTCEGPLHLELLQGEAGTIWDNDVWNGLQHTGVWSTDVAGETDTLVAAGWTLVGAQKPPAEGYGSMSYVQAPSGFVLELVSAAALPRFERWWAGGELA